MRKIHFGILLMIIMIHLTACGTENRSPETLEKSDNEVYKAIEENQENDTSILEQDLIIDNNVTISEQKRIICEREYEPVQLFGELIKIKTPNGSINWVHSNGEMRSELFTGFETYCTYRYLSDNEKYAACYHFDGIAIINEYEEYEYIEEDTENMTLINVGLYHGNPLLIFYKKVESFEGNQESYYLIDEGTKKVYEFDTTLGDYMGNGVFIYKYQESINKPWVYELTNIEVGEKVLMGENLSLRGPYSQDGILSVVMPDEVFLYDKDGNIINMIPHSDWRGGRDVAGRFSEDLVFIDYCFYDKMGNKCIDLSQYHILEFGNVHGLQTMYDLYAGYGWPYFYNGYACLSLENPDGDQYAAIIGKDGEFLFEPVKGRLISRRVRNNCIIVHKEGGFEAVDLEGNILWSVGGDFWINEVSDYCILVKNYDKNCEQVYDYDGNLLLQEIYYYE